jgi:hypothetical protein
MDEADSRYSRLLRWFGLFFVWLLGGMLLGIVLWLLPSQDKMSLTGSILIGAFIGTVIFLARALMGALASVQARRR